MVEYTKWYTLRVLNGKENTVKDRMKYVENFDKYVEDVLVPQEKTITVRNDKKVITTKNLLPGYILVKLKGNMDLDFIKAVEKTSFVSSFLKDHRKHPIPLMKRELKQIMALISSSEESVSEFTVGDKIVIMDGAFANFNGTITEYNPDKENLLVSVKVFGRDTNVDISKNLVKKDV